MKVVVAVFAVVCGLALVSGASQDGLCATRRANKCDGSSGDFTNPDGYTITAEGTDLTKATTGLWGDAGANMAVTNVACAANYYALAVAPNPNGIKVVACATAGEAYTLTGCEMCIAVANSASRTCNGATKEHLKSVTCNTGYYDSGTANSKAPGVAAPDATLACTACEGSANGGNSDCPSATAGTDCDAQGFYWKDATDKCTACAATADGTTLTCTAAAVGDVTSRSCSAGFGKLVAANDDLVCDACFAVAGSKTRVCADRAKGVAAALSQISARTCNDGFYQTGGAGTLACTACKADGSDCTLATSYYDATKCGTTGNLASDGCVTPGCGNACANGKYQASACTILADKVCSDCAAVTGSTARTCDGAGAADIQTVTCKTKGYYSKGTADKDLTCGACAVVANADEVKCTGDTAALVTEVSCADGFGQKGTPLTCQACEDANCMECTADALGTCTTCMSGYGLKVADNTCVKCTAANCAACDGATPATCTSCVSGASMISAKCEKCAKANCLLCATKAAECTSCQAGYLLISHGCDACTTGGAGGSLGTGTAGLTKGGCRTCAKDYYQDAGKRTDCTSTCKSCAGGGTITSAVTAEVATKCDGGSASSIAALASLVVALSSMMF